MLVGPGVLSEAAVRLDGADQRPRGGSRGPLDDEQEG